MTAKLVLENLKHKPMRSLLSILLIGVPVTLILSLVGLSHGMLEDSQRRTRGTPTTGRSGCPSSGTARVRACGACRRASASTTPTC